MKSPLHSLTSRQQVLAAITLAVIVSAVVLHVGILAAFDTWQLLRAGLDEQAAEFARLERNISVRSNVDEAFQRLPAELHQRGSDEATFSQCIRQLEVVRRYPTMMIVNAKPLPVGDEGTHKTYRLRITVAGELPEVVRFVGDLTGGDKAVGIDGFSLRGIQGISKVECSLSIRMIRLTGTGRGRDARRSPSIASSAAENRFGL